jgi:hypothetical protein
MLAMKYDLRCCMVYGVWFMVEVVVFNLLTVLGFDLL